MLGLSATMNRKDGTTSVFKMFLGDVIYKAERKMEEKVEVRAITYKINDDDFNNTILDYKGNPQISSMISKLCDYNRRTEFIIQTLCDFISVDNVDKETINLHKSTMDNNNPFCQICNKNNNYLVKNTCCDVVKYCMPCLHKIVELAKMPEVTIDKFGQDKSVKRRPKCPNCNKVLVYEQNYIENPYVKPISQTHTIVMSHNLNVLEYIYNKFVCKNLASVGYYVGGMSESELKKSENTQVVLSSYSMCSEGLDISTLNAEFLITPKTDVVQIVGRILRSKHKYSHPIIYDFVDSHDVFQKQWLKRKSYYKKQNYKIIGTNSYEYNSNVNKWKTMYEPASSSISVCKNKNNPSTYIRDDSDSEEEIQKDTYLTGKCLLKFKK